MSMAMMSFDIVQSRSELQSFIKPQQGKNSIKVLPQYFAYGRVSWQDN